MEEDGVDVVSLESLVEKEFKKRLTAKNEESQPERFWSMFYTIPTYQSWLVRQNVRRSWRLQGNSTWYKTPQFSSTIFAHYSEKVPWPCKKNEFCQFFSSFFATMFTTSSTIPNVRRNDFSLLTNRQIWISTVAESSLTVRSQKSSPQEFVLVGWKQEQGICLTLYFLGSSSQLVSVK